MLQHCCWSAEPHPGPWLSLVRVLGDVPRQHLPQSASCLALQEPDGVLVLDGFSRAVLHILRQLLMFSCVRAAAPWALPAAKADPETWGGEKLIPKKGGGEREGCCICDKMQVGRPQWGKPEIKGRAREQAEMLSYGAVCWEALISIKSGPARQQLPSDFLRCRESDVNLWKISGKA